MDIQSYARISANRGDSGDEWRLKRLRVALSIAGRKAGTAARRAQLRKAILRVRDHKGDLTILWDGEFHDDELALLVRYAWRQLGQFTPLRHFVRYS